MVAPFSYGLQKPCWSSDFRCIIITGGLGGTSAYSKDGINWTTMTLQNATYNVAYSHELGIYCAIGGNGASTSTYVKKFT